MSPHIAQMSFSRLCAVVSILATREASAQAAPRRMQGCAAMNCEEDVVRSVALDSVLRWPESGFNYRGSPRILSTTHAQPFRRLDGRLSPVVERLSDGDLFLLRRAYPTLRFVDSASVVAKDGATLQPGAPLIVLAPVSWRGESAAVVRLAVYPNSIDYGAEIYVQVAYRGERWVVVRIEFGLQN